MGTTNQQYDLEYRPSSYWAPTGPVAAALVNVKGEQRRQLLRQGLEQGQLDLLEAMQEQTTLSEAERAFTTSVHPLLMGGEYLPDYEEDEVEIARVALQSTTGDVISVRARWAEGRWHYQVVDEYETEFAPVPEPSAEPLTMGELIHLMDTTQSDGFFPGIVFSFLEMNFGSLGEGEPADRETIEDFVTVESEFYPQLGAYYAERIHEWAKENATDLILEEDGEDDEESDD